MGGLISGTGGAGATTAGVSGAISKVSATRIAAIFAGGDNTTGIPTMANAVSALSEITATKIGADLDGGGFSFTDMNANSSFDLGIDTAIDGLVIALTAGYQTASITPPPLKLVLV
jgi:hypothetical protein